MSLKEYKAKRRFDITTEPAPKVKKSKGKGLKFVVQKHDATRLHYDFRLELDGVLKSWAVPKGPSLDPADKRLAVHVEDHPVDYGGFEGVIPEGEYGGGTVAVWDKGTWQPIEGEDAHKGLSSGRLKFEVEGKKLRGKFMLLRLKDGKNWLLFKERDEFVVKGELGQAQSMAPDSVVSGRSLEEIAANKRRRVWHSKPAANKSGTSAMRQKILAGAAKLSAKGAVSKKAAGGLPPHEGGGKKAPAILDLDKLPGAKKAPMPSSYKPQLAVLAEKPPEGDDWIHEIKLDGYRIMSHLRDGRVQMRTRGDLNWASKYPKVAAALAALPLESAVLDGEIVVLNEEGRSEFEALQNAGKPGGPQPVLFLFDLPYLNGYDLCAVPLIARKRLLKAICDQTDGVLLRYNDHSTERGADVLAQACKLQLEGILSKRTSGKYYQRRSDDWLKSKCGRRQEFVIAGFTPGKGSRSGFGSLLLGVHEDGKLVYRGRVGTGFDEKLLHDLSERMKKLVITNTALSGPLPRAETREATWIRPELVAEVKFTEMTREKYVRHAVFMGLRTDKPASSITDEPMKPAPKRAAPREKVSGTFSENESFPDEKAAKTKKDRKKVSGTFSGDRKKASGTFSGDVLGVRVTSPDRVLYEKPKLTKSDLIDYYLAVGEKMLPYVVDRPLSLVRCPEGVNGEKFFQRHYTASMPDELTGVDVSDPGEKEPPHVMLNDVAGLIAMAQMSVLEIHVWGCPADNIEQADQMTFDLDPGPGVSWKKTVEGATELHDILKAANLKSFVKTSGGKGLHIVVPLRPAVEWKVVEAFAGAIVNHLVSTSPGKYVGTMSKLKREGKIFIDHFRNRRSSTTVAPYSTRAREGAAVSAPLSWDELKDTKSGDEFNIPEMMTRMKRQRKDPWAEFHAVKQTLSAELLKRK